MRLMRPLSILVLGFTLASCGGTAAVSSSSGGAAASVAVAPSSAAAAPASSAAAKPSAAASTAASAGVPASAKPSAASSAPATSAASAGSAAASSAAGASSAAPTGTPIKLGILDDVTGVGAIEGALMRINADLVISQINSTGGINGHPVQAVYADPKGQADQALSLATSLAQQDKVDVLLGAIFSPECLGVQKLAPKVGLAYLPLNGCANEQFTATSCNTNSFRVFPVGKQLSDPALKYEVKTFGKKWAILYPDYALGQSTRDSYTAGLKANGASLDLKIAVPLNEPNMTPYISKIPTDGSINALVVSETGSDLARAMSILQQFGIPKKMAIVTALGKESFAGVYPAAMNGAYIAGVHLSEPEANNKFDQAYDAAFKAMAHKDASIAGPLGGPDKAVSGTTNGYNVYMSMNALKIAMRKSGFTGRADTSKLISALADLGTQPQGPDFPAGPMIMNKSDHQGRSTLYIMKINGQKEDVIQTLPPDQLPQIGNCQVGS